MKRYLVFAEGPLKNQIYREFSEEEYKQSPNKEWILPIKYRVCRCCGKILENRPYVRGKVLLSPVCEECKVSNANEQDKYRRKPAAIKDTTFKILELGQRNVKDKVIPWTRIYK